tara:strand:- start:752 stop:964 length:213 start_codon:yes stop_codon:yes gene_type:complete
MSEQEEENNLSLEHFIKVLSPAATLGLFDLLFDIKNRIDQYLVDMVPLVKPEEELPDNVSKLHIPGTEGK